MNLKDYMPKKKEIFLWIKESKVGIETYANPVVRSLSPFYKKQIRAFLEEIIKEMK